MVSRMRYLKTAAISAAIVGMMFTTGCEPALFGNPNESKPATLRVAMQKMEFSPATLEIKKGDVVEWKNDDITPHTATSPAFGDSGAVASGKSWRHTFTETGTFPYTCTFHPGMKGVIVVK